MAITRNIETLAAITVGIADNSEADGCKSVLDTDLVRLFSDARNAHLTATQSGQRRGPRISARNLLTIIFGQ